MAKHSKDDAYREKFRPDADSALDREIDAALGGMSIEDLYDKGQTAPAGKKAELGTGMRKGRVIRVSKDDVFIDFGGKSQGVVPFLQFEEEPKVGQEFDFHVERYDAREGLLILTRK